MYVMAVLNLRYRMSNTVFTLFQITICCDISKPFNNTKPHESTLSAIWHAIHYCRWNCVDVPHPSNITSSRILTHFVPRIDCTKKRDLESDMNCDQLRLYHPIHGHNHHHYWSIPMVHYDGNPLRRNHELYRVIGENASKKRRMTINNKRCSVIWLNYFKLTHAKPLLAIIQMNRKLLRPVDWSMLSRTNNTANVIKT